MGNVIIDRHELAKLRSDLQRIAVIVDITLDTAQSEEDYAAAMEEIRGIVNG